MSEPISACGDSAQNVACDETCPECIYKPKSEPMSPRGLALYLYYNGDGPPNEDFSVEIIEKWLAKIREEDAKTIKELRDALGFMLEGIRKVQENEPVERTIPCHHTVMDIRIAILALAKGKE